MVGLTFNNNNNNNSNNLQKFKCLFSLLISKIDTISCHRHYFNFSPLSDPLSDKATKVVLSFKLKMHQNPFGAGLCPDPLWELTQVSK